MALVSLSSPLPVRLRTRARASAAALSLMGTVLTVACGGGDGGSTGPAARPVATLQGLPSSLTLLVGQDTTLTVQALDASGQRIAAPTLNWTNNATGVVTSQPAQTTVQLHATAPGVATLTVSGGAATATVNVTVRTPSAAGVRGLPTELRLVAGQDTVVPFTVEGPNGAPVGNAQINVKGGMAVVVFDASTPTRPMLLATAVGSDVLQIEFTGDNGVRGAATVPVVVRPASIALSPKALSGAIGDTVATRATAYDRNGNVVPLLASSTVTTTADGTVAAQAWSTADTSAPGTLVSRARVARAGSGKLTLAINGTAVDVPIVGGVLARGQARLDTVVYGDSLVLRAGDPTAQWAVLDSTAGTLTSVALANATATLHAAVGPKTWIESKPGTGLRYAYDAPTGSVRLVARAGGVADTVQVLVRGAATIRTSPKNVCFTTAETKVPLESHASNTIKPVDNRTGAALPVGPVTWVVEDTTLFGIIQDGNRPTLVSYAVGRTRAFATLTNYGLTLTYYLSRIPAGADPRTQCWFPD